MRIGNFVNRAARRTSRADWAGRTLGRYLTRAHVLVYRYLKGRLVGSIGGAPVLLLTTTGRRTGQRRTRPLIYVPGRELAVVASNGGATSDPHWYLNLLSLRAAQVQVRRDTMLVHAGVARGSEHDRVWRAAVALYPPYADYERAAGRQLPVVILERPQWQSDVR